MIDEAGEFDQVPEECWARWSGAILWFRTVPSETGDRDLKSRLLEHATAQDHDRMASLLRRFVRGELRRGGLASEVGSFPPSSILRVLGAWIELTKEAHHAVLTDATADDTDDADAGPIRIPPGDDARGNARFTWERLFTGLIDADPVDGQPLAVEWLRDAGSAAATELAARAVALLVSRHPASWTAVRPLVEGSAETGRAVDVALGDERCHTPLEADLDEHQLGEFYEWLAKFFPPESDPPDILGSS